MPATIDLTRLSHAEKDTLIAALTARLAVIAVQEIRIAALEARLEAHAKAQYRQFDEQRKIQRVTADAAEISALKAADRDLPARRPRKPKTG